jgi:hypothetical protein
LATAPAPFVKGRSDPLPPSPAGPPEWTDKGQFVDNDVHMVRSRDAPLTRVSLRGNTERMIAFVTDVVVLTKRVAK